MCLLFLNLREFSRCYKIYYNKTKGLARNLLRVIENYKIAETLVSYHWKSKNCFLDSGLYLIFEEYSYILL